MLVVLQLVLECPNFEPRDNNVHGNGELRQSHGVAVLILKKLTNGSAKMKPQWSGKPIAGGLVTNRKHLVPGQSLRGLKHGRGIVSNPTSAVQANQCANRCSADQRGVELMAVQQCKEAPIAVAASSSPTQREHHFAMSDLKIEILSGERSGLHHLLAELSRVHAELWQNFQETRHIQLFLHARLKLVGNLPGMGANAPHQINVFARLSRCHAGELGKIDHISQRIQGPRWKTVRSLKVRPQEALLEFLESLSMFPEFLNVQAATTPTSGLTQEIRLISNCPKFTHRLCWILRSLHSPFRRKKLTIISPPKSTTDQHYRTSVLS